MGKGKKPSGKTYVSKGQRRSVARKVTNAVRRERKANPPFEDLAARIDYVHSIMTRKGGGEEIRNAKQKILDREALETRAGQLYEKYRKAGVTWAACVQAVKTDWVSDFENKWHRRLDEKGSK